MNSPVVKHHIDKGKLTTELNSVPVSRELAGDAVGEDEAVARGQLGPLLRVERVHTTLVNQLLGLKQKWYFCNNFYAKFGTQSIYRASHVLEDWVLLTWIWDVPPSCLGSR